MTPVGDVLVCGGPIRTVAGPTLVRGALVLRGGRIAEVIDDIATADDLDALATSRGITTRHDLAGRTLAPGFVDAHNHLSVAALYPVFGDASAVRTEADLASALRAHAAVQPDAAILRWHGWDDTRCDFTLDRHVLDRVAELADRPMILAHSSLHQCVANTAALDVLGIGATTPDPLGGEIARAADGMPTGLLQETAWSEAHRRSLAAYADPDRWEELIAERARALVRTGITALHDAACAPEAEARYRAMATAGTLPLSVVVMPHASALLRNDLGGRLDGAPTGDGDERVRVGAVKLFADGGIAIALDVALGGHPIRYGYLMDDLHECAARAAARGFRIAIHAIGNRGVDHALDAFASVAAAHPGHDHRFRLEHAGVTGPAQWQRAADLGVVGVVQPGFVEHVGISSGGVRFDDHHWLAFGGLAEAGVRLAGSSDDPCAPVAPLWCIDRGVFRTTSTGIAFEPEQSVGFDDWLRAYTLDAAHAGGQEHERGSLEAGKVADLVELDGLDARGGHPGAPGAVTVAATWVGGVRHPAT